MQVTAILIFALATTPLAFATVQVSPVGCVSTLTAYFAPLGNAVLKLKLALTETGVLLAALFCRTTLVPVNNPVRVPPTVKVGAAGEALPPQAVKQDTRTPISGKIRRFDPISTIPVDQELSFAYVLASPAKYA